MPPLDRFARSEPVSGSAASGLDAIRRSQRGPAGRLALRLRTPVAPARRRVAQTLLEEAGRSSGGVVLESVSGELILTEADAADGARVASLLSGLLGETVERIDLPEGALVLAAMPGLSLAAPAFGPPPSASGIEAMADAIPLPSLLRRDGVLHLAPAEPQHLAMIRLRIDARSIAPFIGAAADDADLARHVRDRLRGRLLAALSDPARRDGKLGALQPVPLLVDLPLSLLPQIAPEAAADNAPPVPALFAAVSVNEAMCETLEQQRPALHRAGWGLAVRGLDALRLPLISLDALAGDLLLIRWSPAIADRASAAALRRIDPQRLVLTRCDGTAALEWGLSMGIRYFAGAWIDELLAARRMKACAFAGACTRAACALRGRAATVEGRQGCGDRRLLAALLPDPGTA